MMRDYLIMDIFVNLENKLCQQYGVWVVADLIALQRNNDDYCQGARRCYLKA